MMSSANQEGGELASEFVQAFSARFNGGEGYGRSLWTEKLKRGSEAGGRLMDRPLSIQPCWILRLAEIGLGLVAPRPVVGAAAPAGVR